MGLPPPHSAFLDPLVLIRNNDHILFCMMYCVFVCTFNAWHSASAMQQSVNADDTTGLDLLANMCTTEPGMVFCGLMK